VVWLVGGLYTYEAGVRLGARLLVWAGSHAQPPFATLIQLDTVSHEGKRLRARAARDAIGESSECGIRNCEPELYQEVRCMPLQNDR